MSKIVEWLQSGMLLIVRNEVDGHLRRLVVVDERIEERRKGGVGSV